MKICMILVGLLGAYIIWQKWELTRFRTKEYQITSDKIKEDASVVVIADLHGYTYGAKNSRLLKQVDVCHPQAILIAGDLIVSKYAKTFPVALDFLMELVKIAPVYYCFGNHETRLRNKKKINHEAFIKYLDQVQKIGVTILNNQSVHLLLGQNKVTLSGLELGIDYFEKGKQTSLDPQHLKKILGISDANAFQILLAHNPTYAKEYAQWGADVTFCGHNHGGLIRIPGIGSLLSPQLIFFPKYDSGMFSFYDKKVVVSRGLGTHTFHIRIFDRAELLNISLTRQSKHNIKTKS
ncbi:MAG: metallophosphoesterase [Lachnospiraceae bacterium]